MRDKKYWEKRLSDLEGQLGYGDGWKFLYCPWATITTSTVAFISLNPGRAPDDAELRCASDERGNSYEVEKDTTVSPITDQFLRLCELIGTAPIEILAGVVMPFRTDRWINGRDRKAIDLVGREFWRELFAESAIRLVFAIGDETTKALVDILDARMDMEIPALWGNYRLRRYVDGKGTYIVSLLHLSRFRLMTSEERKAQVLSLIPPEFLNSKAPDVRAH